MGHRRRRYRSKPKNQINIKKPQSNEEITAATVRLIGPEGEQLGEVPLSDAKQRAQDAEMDLVAVAEKANPPVVRIMDMGKHIYEQRKKQAKQKAQVKGGETKGIRITFKMGVHDQEVRLRQAAGFLDEGNRVKLEMRLRGREKGRLEMAEDKLKDFVKMLENSEIDGGISKTPNSISAVISRSKPSKVDKE